MAISGSEIMQYSLSFAFNFICQVSFRNFVKVLLLWLQFLLFFGCLNIKKSLTKTCRLHGNNEPDQLLLMLKQKRKFTLLTECFGEFRTGKTQIAHTLCVTAQMPGPGHGRVSNNITFSHYCLGNGDVSKIEERKIFNNIVYEKQSN